MMVPTLSCIPACLAAGHHAFLPDQRGHPHHRQACREDGGVGAGGLVPASAIAGLIYVGMLLFGFKEAGFLPQYCREFRKR